MGNKEYFLTPEGVVKLKAELAELTGPKREDLSARLREAIQQGDLSENADYSAAKEEQAFLEGRVQEIEEILANHVIIEKKSNGLVEIGSTITIQADGEEPETYYIVGTQEADPGKGRISHESPIGVAVIGHKKGDKVTAQTPGGSFEFTIVSVE
jgi:transcription elongation factor GreA